MSLRIAVISNIRKQLGALEIRLVIPFLYPFAVLRVIVAWTLIFFFPLDILRPAVEIQFAKAIPVIA